MSLNDAVPERRNAIIISMLVITYHVADGELGKTLKLPLSSIELHNTFAAGVIFWLIFLWLGFRYYLVFRNEAFDESSEGIRAKKNWRQGWKAAVFDARCGKTVYRIMTSVATGNGNVTPTVMKNQSEQEWHLYFENFSKVQMRSNNMRSTLAASDSKPQNIVMILISLVQSFFTKPYLSAWYSPWLLGLTAVILSVYSFFWG